MDKVLIVGANSVSGKCLYNLIKQSGKDLYFCDLTDSYEASLSNKWYKSDLSSYNKIYTIIKKVLPLRIYNFAGSFTNDFEIDYKANVLLSRNILDSVINLNLNTKVLLIGSAAEYGIINSADNPIKETRGLNPASIYGLTKTFQTNLMLYYYNVKKANVLMARTFNLLNKNLSEKLFIGRLFKQIDSYKKGEINKIIVGNINNKRDYIDADIAVQKYELIMEKGKAGEVYNVGSGKSTLIKDLLESILIDNGLSMDIVESFNQPNSFDVKEIFADTGKLDKLKV